jgi:hypothetical protein
MELSFGWIVTLFLIGMIGSLISGMVGIGGSIVKYPMLLYIPPLLGLSALTAQEVSAVNAVQVFFASLAGMFAYRKDGLINGKLVLSMGVPMLAGSFLGGYGSRLLSDHAINLTYALMALAAAIMMFVPRKEPKPETGDRPEVTFPVPLAVLSSATIGLMSGIVGAAGAFITVPVMLTLLRIPTRVAIASSLVITFLSSVGSAAGKVMGGSLLVVPAVVMIVASIIGSPAGAMLGKRMDVRALRWILATLITATVVKIWADLLLK